MVKIEMTSHLYRFFPQLEQLELLLPPGSVAELLLAINEIAPGFTAYVLDDNNALRRHVMISINNNLLVDRQTLSDQVDESSTLYIFQSLTGG